VYGVYLESKEKGPNKKLALYVQGNRREKSREPDPERVARTKANRRATGAHEI
jgi:hypothetical protein